jgi:hypothetical protein
VYVTTAWAAAITIASVMVRAPQAIAPAPRPGNTKALLPWGTTRVVPPWVIAVNGEPAAASARPSVHAASSAGVASAELVGFDSGNTIGRAVLAATARTTSSVNAPACPDSPSSAVAPARRTVVARSSPPHPATRSRGCAKARLYASSGRSSTSRPRESSTRMRARAWSRLRPSATMPRASCSATPIPPAPAPWTTMTSSRRRRPASRDARVTPASATAPVPWMSSLNDGWVARNASSTVNAASMARSSHWITARGQRRPTARTNRSMNAT